MGTWRLGNPRRDPTIFLEVFLCHDMKRMGTLSWGVENPSSADWDTRGSHGSFYAGTLCLREYPGRKGLGWDPLGYYFKLHAHNSKTLSHLFSLHADTAVLSVRRAPVSSERRCWLISEGSRCSDCPACLEWEWKLIPLLMFRIWESHPKTASAFSSCLRRQLWEHLRNAEDRARPAVSVASTLPGSHGCDESGCSRDAQGCPPESMVTSKSWSRARATTGQALL